MILLFAEIIFNAYRLNKVPIIHTTIPSSEISHEKVNSSLMLMIN